MMIKSSLAFVAVLSLAACGGSRYASSNAVPDSGFAPPAPVSATVQTIAAPNVAGVVQSVPAPVPVIPFAKGPIQRACEASDRKARSRTRCGCIQAVADKELSSAQQRRGARYWKDPGKLQEVRQSDNPGNEKFWRAWKAYGQTAARICRGS